MNRLLSLLILALFTTDPCVSANMKDIWLSMPDSIIPYLDKNLRLQFLDYESLHVNTTVTNKLHGESKLDTLTSDFIRIQLSQSSSIEIKRLPYAAGDSILCVIKTYGTDMKESQIAFYKQQWDTLPIRTDFLHSHSATSNNSHTYANHAPIPQEATMIWLSLDVSSENLTIYQTDPIGKEKADNSTKQQRIVKWNLKTFN